ncbi:MAG TPA: hypothetical protein VKB93_01580 [Thermoanaerobaculia bacterium]|nr:hypothetical protein [Thermoanaerobaculia bacterium]
MTAHVAPQLLRQYKARMLPPEEIPAVVDHLGRCAVCREAAGESITLATAARRWQEALADVDDHVTSIETVRPAKFGRRAKIGATIAGAALIAAAFFLSPYVRSRRSADQPRATSPQPPAPIRRSEPVASELSSLSPDLRRIATTLLGGVSPNRQLHLLLHPSTGVQRNATRDRIAGRILAPLYVIQSDRPTFSWVPQTPGTSSVQVFDMEFNLVMESPRLNGTSWRPPRPIPRAATYQWQVVVHRTSGDEVFPAAPAAPARFHILSGTTIAELGRHESELDRGLIFAREGMLPEAAAAFEAYRRAHPSSDLAERLAAAVHVHQP